MPKTAAPDATKAFLNSIGRVPLLTADQEIELSRAVQAGLAAEALPPSAERDRIIAIGQKAKRKMVEANLRLVVAIAKKYQNRGLELLDLIQEGTLGLDRAAEKFDASKGYKFSTYAYWWIRQGITRAIANDAKTIRIPIHINEKLNKVKRVKRKLTAELGRSPSMTELAAEMGIDIAKLSDLLAATRETYSLDRQVKNGDGDSDSLGAFITGSNGWDTFEEIANDDLITCFLSCLTPAEKQLVWFRYGFADGEARTIKSVAAKLNISQKLAKSLQRKALIKLKSRRSLFEFSLV